jgi:signal transduction histidine kinase
MLIEGHETTFDESVLGSLKIIRSAAERQLGIIEDALEIFQFEKGKELEMEKGDLGGVAHDVIETHLQEVKEKKMEITVNGKPFSPKDRASLVCSFNRSKISRVIENLIGNALKYAKNSIDLSYESKGNFVEVRVRDDGEGIPEKYVDKIFQDFFQIPGSQKGTGLGLSSAKRIVEAHTGRIWVDPSPGRCSFHFTLPL